MFPILTTFYYNRGNSRLQWSIQENIWVLLAEEIFYMLDRLTDTMEDLNVKIQNYNETSLFRS